MKIPEFSLKSKAPFADADAKDKPLGFYWKTPADWLADLDLPPPRNVRYGRARAAILLDAVIEAHGKGRAISYSRRKGHYTGQQRYQGTAYSYSTVPRAVDELAALGLLDNAKVAPFTSPGRQSTLRASPNLVGTVDLPPVSFCPPELVLLKDDGKHLVDYRDTERTDRMRRELAAINEALGSVNITLDGMTPDGPFLHFPPGAGKAAGSVANVAKTTVYRVFNVSWCRGGRHYGPWAQSIPKEYRPALLMDGQPIAEPDYKELHPTLLYALEGKRLDGEAYDVDGWPRKLVKVVFNVVINAKDKTAAHRKVALKIGGKGSFQQAAQLIAAIEDRHQAIARHFYSGVGLKLQYRDSCMASQVMRRLRGQGVVAVPVHDSFIVPATAEGILLEAMDEALKAATNGLISMGRNCRKSAFGFKALSQNGTTSGPPAPSRPFRVWSRQRDFFGADVAEIGTWEFSAFSGGIVPLCICRATRLRLANDAMTQDELAHRLDISRPHLVNVLHGRFGLSPAPTAKLKAFLKVA